MTVINKVLNLVRCMSERVISSQGKLQYKKWELSSGKIFITLFCLSGQRNFISSKTDNNNMSN